MEHVTLIESSTNELGLEVKHERAMRVDRLCVYRNGTRMAERRVFHKEWRGNVDYFGALQPETCVEIDRALDEGLRLLRDGRGMAAST
jgi:hypothetical protein